MGAIAEGIVAYVKPLIDQTDGSMEQIKKAFAMGQLCYNLALLSDDALEKSFGKTRESLQMDDEEFEEFQRTILVPMIQRHREMFPQLHRRLSSGTSLLGEPEVKSCLEIYPGTDAYAPCPCQSGRKYKFCCDTRRR